MPASRSFAVVAIFVSVVLSGCTRTLNMEDLHRKISTGLSEQLGMPIQAVVCPPEARALKAGDTFQCTATPAPGGKLTIDVTQKDENGNVHWTVSKTEGLLDLDKAEAAVVAGFKSQAQMDATADCGGRWKLAKPGDTFECQVTVADGKKFTVVVTADDAVGNISWKVK